MSGYAVGSVCYATEEEAGIAHAQQLGDGQTLIIANEAYRLKQTPLLGGHGWLMQTEIIKVSDESYLVNDMRGYSLPGCGTLDPADWGVTPVQVAQVVAWGFGVVLLGWLLGYAIGRALEVIKKA